MPTIIEQIKSQLGIYEISEFCGIEVKDKSKPYQKVLCPFHNEKTPSLSLFNSKGIFRCFACGKQGDQITLYSELKHIPLKDAIRELSDKLGIKRDITPKKTKETKTIKLASLEEKMEAFHRGLLNNEYMMKKLYEKRKLNIEYIKEKKIGYYPNTTAFSIPIFDENKKLINIRYHKIDSKDKWGTKNCQAKVLYDILSFNRETSEVWICEGEGDLWTMAHLLKFNAITTIVGVESIPDLVQNNFKLFKDKEIFIVLDNDMPGKMTTAKLRLLFDEKQQVKRVDWKEFGDKFDISDFVIRNGKGRDDLLALMNPYPLKEAKEYLERINNERETFRDKSNPITENNGVYVRDDGKEEERISSFLINGKAFIEVEGNISQIPEGWLKADIVNYNGYTKENILFPPSTFASKQNLIKTINNPIFNFKGSDKDVHNISELILKKKMPIKKGVKSIGFHDGNFICPNFIIGKDGVMDESSIEYIPQGSFFDDMFHIRTDGFYEMLPKFVGNILFANDTELMIPILGWLIACYYKEHIKNKISYFPIMTFFGSSGSGKTSLAVQLWKLFGIKSRDMLLSAHSTKFTIMRTLSSTKVIPTIIDEVKFDIGKDLINFWKQMLRSVYFGEIEMRGRPDLTVVKFPYESPLVLIGETNIIKEVATVERTIQITFDRVYLNRHKECQDSFKELRTLPLESFMPNFIMWLLHEDFVEFDKYWLEAREQLFSFQLPPVGDRVIDNLTVVLFGINALDRFVQFHDMKLLMNPDDIRKALSRIIGQILTVKGRPKNAVDEFIEAIGILIKEDKLRSNVNYKIEGDKVYIHINSCVPVFKRWCREFSFDGEVLDRKEYNNLIKEMVGTYITKNNLIKRVGNTVHRVVEIDLKEAQNMGLDISGYGISLLDDKEDEEQMEMPKE